MPESLCWILMLGSVLVAGVSQLLLKAGAKKGYTSPIREYLNPYVIFGYGLMVLSTLLTLFAYKFGLGYKDGPVIESIGYLLILLLSFFCFKERITWKKALGNAIVIGGIIIFYL